MAATNINGSCSPGTSRATPSSAHDGGTSVCSLRVA